LIRTEKTTSYLFQENVVLGAGYAFQQIIAWHRQTPDLSWTVDE
jgi:hypothetical protein